MTFNFKSVDFDILSNTSQKNFFKKQIVDTAIREFEQGGLIKLTEKDFDEIIKLIKKTESDCNSLVECRLKAEHYFSMVKDDADFCKKKVGGKAFKDDNFFKPGNEWYHLYRIFVNEEFLQ